MISTLQLLSIAIVYATGGDAGGTPYNGSIVKPPSTRSSEGSAPAPSPAGDDDETPFTSMLSTTDSNSYMDCGGAPQCGVLVLETGFGAEMYEHAAPVVHGLWPQTGNYGSSKCVAPNDPTPPQRVYPCYAANQDESPAQQLSFEQHEWKAHGRCSGAEDADDFFGQVCDLSSKPLAVMASLRSAGARELSAFVTKLTASGYHIFYSDSYHSQVQLSACAGDDGQWILARPSEFAEQCGGGGDGSLEQHRAGTQQTTPTPSAEPILAPVPEVDFMAKRVKSSREVSPMRNCPRTAGTMSHFFSELARVRIGDKSCFKRLISKLSNLSCAELASASFIRRVGCHLPDYVQPEFLTVTEDVCRYMGDAYFAKTMRDRWFPDLSTLDVGVSDVPVSW